MINEGKSAALHSSHDAMDAEGARGGKVGPRKRGRGPVREGVSAMRGSKCA
jgi:hypothetical protein